MGCTYLHHRSAVGCYSAKMCSVKWTATSSGIPPKARWERTRTPCFSNTFLAMKLSIILIVIVNSWDLSILEDTITGMPPINPGKQRHPSLSSKKAATNGDLVDNRLEIRREFDLNKDIYDKRNAARTRQENLLGNFAYQRIPFRSSGNAFGYAMELSINNVSIFGE